MATSIYIAARIRVNAKLQLSVFRRYFLQGRAYKVNILRPYLYRVHFLLTRPDEISGATLGREVTRKKCILSFSLFADGFVSALIPYWLNGCNELANGVLLPPPSVPVMTPIHESVGLPGVVGNCQDDLRRQGLEESTDLGNYRKSEGGETGGQPETPQWDEESEESCFCCRNRHLSGE
jgi:hypothetical protein